MKSRARPLTRRRFMGQVGGVGASVGASALLAACGGGGGDFNGFGGAGNGGSGGSGDGSTSAPTEQRTVFFNLSNVASGPDTTHYLRVGSRKVALTAVADAPHVLSNARAGNAFLRAVPDDQITHHVEAMSFSTTTVTLVSVTTNEQPDNGGTWEMVMVYFNIPSTAVPQAFAQARALQAVGALPLSGKRERYGIAAATSTQDFVDEHSLVDSHSHAEALVGLYPDCLSIDPGSAANVHHNYISVDSNTKFLGNFLGSLGPAVAVGAKPGSGATPWATLTPLIDKKAVPPAPYKMSDGKLNQYQADWNSNVDRFMARAVQNVQPRLRDEPSFGNDITGRAGARAPVEAFRGKLWYRSDGVASVARKLSSASTEASLGFDFQHKNFDAGLGISNPTTTLLGDGRVQVSIDNISNWFLRFLGAYVRFDASTGPIRVKDLPSDTVSQNTLQKASNTEFAVYVGALAPAYTLAGVPISPGTLSASFKIPLQATGVTFVMGGLGFNGSNPFGNDGDDYTTVGMLLTFVVDFVIVGFCTALGAADLDGAVEVIVTAVEVLVNELIDVLGSVLDTPVFKQADIVALVVAMMQVVIDALITGKSLETLAEALLAIAASAEIIDAVPVAGQIARAVAAVIGAVSLAESAIEVALSPPVYTYEGTLTHDLGVNILPGAGNTRFPEVAGYTVYYKVSYVFDSGTTHVLDAIDVVGDPNAIPIKLSGIPRGGQVNIKVGFYARKPSTPAGQNDWCAAFGETGLFSNTVDQAPDLTITQRQIPIQPTTLYLHTRKTHLDDQGMHSWQTTTVAPPYTPPPGAQQPGLGDFRSITMRQGTSQPPRQGYVGYAWNAFSSGVVGCAVGSNGQLDQLAVFSTDPDNAGASDADIYARSGCGLQPGALMGFDLISSDARNFYLDSDGLFVRQVQLGRPPAIADPKSSSSYGRFNFGADRLLLHPAGHLVSISTDNHKIEALRLPGAPIAAGATVPLARTYAGRGTRPGLITSPTAAAISADGVILILEGSGGNNRIQAFDLGGNPVPYFKQQKQPYWLTLDATPHAQYLDLAVEFAGYVYVLSKDGGNNHRLDIYHPSQIGTQPICTTQGVNAARLTVDFWRTVYTLNYEVLQLPGGGLPPFTEPSISAWLPSPPQT